MSFNESAYPFLVNGAGTDQSVYEAVTSPKLKVGEKAITSDGKVFYYCSYVGASALTRGVVLRPAARTAAAISAAYSSGGAAESRTVTITAAGLTKNMFANGTLWVHDGTGAGQERTIESNTATSGGTVDVVVRHPFDIAIGSGAEISLMLNPYASVVAQTGTTREYPVGVPQFAVPAGDTNTQYFFVQTAGRGIVLGNNATFLDGSAVVMSDDATADAGQVEIGGANDLVRPIGTVIEAADGASDGDYRLVDFCIKY